MKILGGKYKGRNIFMPAGIRPTQNVARKAVFDILGNNLDGIEFLELFAGSGAVGIEALSCNAQKVVFVEKEQKCVNVLQENLEKIDQNRGVKESGFYEVVNLDAYMAVKMFAEQKRVFDVVFVDPPFGRELAKKALKTLEAYAILHPNSLIIIQHDRKEILPEDEGVFVRFKQKKYGLSVIDFYKLK